MCEQKDDSFKCILKAKPYNIHSTTGKRYNEESGGEKDGATRYSLNQPGNPCHRLAIK